nr:ATP-binding protein [Cohnella sp. REN36]
MVDDHPENLLAIEAVLEGEPYRLIRAFSGADALRCLLREEVAVILLDVQMPGMDGFETARHIKSYDRSKHIPILFITATSKETSHMSAGYSAGAVDYMIKPFVPHILKAKIKAFVQLYDAQKQLLSQTRQLEKVNANLLEATAKLSKAEAQARAVMDTSIDTMVVYGHHGEILQANPAAERMFGYSQEELVGRNMSLLLPSIHWDLGHTRGLVGKVIEVVPARKDGSTFPAEMQLGESLADPALRTCTVRDIADRKRSELALLESKELAEQAARMKTEFLSFMTHEIRTPLNGVIGMMDILIESGLTQEQRELADVVLKSGHTLLGIVNDVLDYSKIESGRMELEEEPFFLRACLEQVQDIFTAPIREKRLEMRYLIDPALPLFVRGDLARLQQVLLNLVGNAVKFTETGGVYIVVRQAAATEEELTVEVTVIDTGIGIPADRADELFEPFSQVDASMNRKYGGTGLGLAISKTLVEMMSGEIWTEPSEHGGAIFAFTAKVKRADPPEEMPAFAKELAAVTAEAGWEEALRKPVRLERIRELLLQASEADRRRIR